MSALLVFARILMLQSSNFFSSGIHAIAVFLKMVVFMCTYSLPMSYFCVSNL